MNLLVCPAPGMGVSGGGVTVSCLEADPPPSSGSRQVHV